MMKYEIPLSTEEGKVNANGWMIKVGILADCIKKFNDENHKEVYIGYDDPAMFLKTESAIVIDNNKVSFVTNDILPEIIAKKCVIGLRMSIDADLLPIMKIDEHNIKIIDSLKIESVSLISEEKNTIKYYSLDEYSKIRGGHENGKK